MKERLRSVLERSQTVGFLGPNDVDEHIVHAEAFSSALTCKRFVDIGSGGGVPALPLLVFDDSLSATLVDTSQKRCSFLVWATAELGLTERVKVWRGRAEVLAHSEDYRLQFDAVTARSFGPPSWTFECAVGFLRLGGQFVVSEPPVKRGWPPSSELERYGMEQTEGFEGVARFKRIGDIPPELPRSFKTAKLYPLLQVQRP